MSDMLVPPPPPPPPFGRPHGKQPVGQSEPPVADEAEARLLLQVASPVRCRLERVTVPSVMRSAETSANTRRVDPAADLWEVTEQNAREKRDEEEADRLEKAEAEKAAASAQKKLEEAEAAVAARRQAEEAAHRQSALFVISLSSAPPPPEFTGQTGEASAENPIVEKESGEASMSDTLVPPPLPPPPQLPSRSTRDK